MALSRLPAGATFDLPAGLVRWLPLPAALCIALAFLPVPIAAAAVIGLLGGAVVIARPEVALYLLAFLVPFGSLVEFQIGGAAVDPSLPVIGWLGFAWAARLARGRGENTDRPWPGPLAGLVAGWIAFVGALALSVPDAAELGAGTKEAVKWLMFGFVLILTDRLIDRPGRLNRLILALVVAATAEALVGWAQFFFGIGPEGFQLGRFLRAYGTYGQPNPFAGYLNTVWPLAYLLALAGAGRAFGRVRARPPGSDRRAALFRCATAIVLALTPLVILTGAIGMSLSRGAWLALTAAILVTNLLLGPRARALTIAAALVGALIFLAGAANLLPAAISERITSAAENYAIFDARQARLTPENWAIVERMATWQAGWEMFRDHPILGVGAGNFNAAYEDYRLKEWPYPPGHAHNVYLNVLAEMGVIGLAGYLAFVAGCFGLALTGILRRRDGATRGPPDRSGVAPLLPGRWIGIAALGALTGLTVHNLLDNLYVHGMTIHLGLLLGLAAAAAGRTSAPDEATV